jgi:hypothetical protein
MKQIEIESFTSNGGLVLAHTLQCHSPYIYKLKMNSL